MFKSNAEARRAVVGMLAHKKHLQLDATTTHSSAVVDAECTECRSVTALTVPTSGLIGWARGGILIQDALPTLTADDRELLISGMCGECFDTLMGGFDFMHTHTINGVWIGE